MSSSEPRLPFGEGLSEVRASPVAPQLDGATFGAKSPPLVPSSSQPGPTDTALMDSLAAESKLVSAESLNGGNTVVAASSKLQSAAAEDREALPPLVSLNDMVLEAPPWLFSAALHMAAIILLGLLLIAPQRHDPLVLRFDASEKLGDDLSDGELDVSLDMTAQEVGAALAPQQLPEIEDPLAVSPTMIEAPSLSTPVAETSTAIRMALTGREQGMQQALLDAYGGTAATQRAVLEGLRWLARNQGKRGLWSLRGRYADGVDMENHEAATALALLAFQGAGYTPQGDPKEPFTQIVARAWTSLLARQEDDGNFFHSGRGHGQLYTQALCTIAICELYGMTHDPRYKEPAQRAIDFCTKIQSPEGGWRYFPGLGSDLSVTGWFVMAMQSARMAGLEVPSPTLDRIRGFLDSVSREGGSRYAYQTKEGASRSMTAEGLLCRQYLGWPHSDRRLQKGAEYLTEYLPNWKRGERNVYYWYYATQVCHHMEGRHWRTWNDAMRVVLPSHQVQEGRERGSWDPNGDRWGNSGGRLFVTCLSVYMLEVYYRHLPIYQADLLAR